MAAADEDGESAPVVLARSGNVLLPGAFTNTPGFAGLAGYDLLPGNLTPAGAGPEGGFASNGLNSAFGGALTIEQNGNAAPQVTINGGVDVASLAGPSSALSPLTPVAQGASLPGATVLNNNTGGTLASAGPAGVSVAGQPLVSMTGTNSVLSNSGSVAGAAGSVGSIVSGVNPSAVTPQVLNAAAGGTAAAMNTPPPAGSPAPGATPVAGLGGLTGLLPPLRR